MQTMMFITFDDKPKGERKYTLWCQTNDVRMFRDFMQFVLDGCSRPEEYVIYDKDNNAAYNFMDIAVKVFEMRKRTFDERMNNIQTGKWMEAVTI